MAPRVTPAAAAISWSVVRVTPWRAKTLRAAARMPRRVRSDSRFVLRKSKTQHLCHTFVIVYYTRALEPNSQTRDDLRMASVHARPEFRGRYGLLSPSLPALAGLIAAALLAGCEQGGANTPASNPAAAGISAKVLQVAPQRVPIVLEAVGQVQGSKEVEVRARVSGILLKRLYNEGDFVREGSLVTAGQDSSLLTTMNQVDPVWIRFSLSESDLAKLPERRLDRIKSAEVRLALPDGSRYPLAGRLNFAATQIDPRLATQELRAAFGNPRVQLLPGQFVRVQVAAGERDNVFLVPQTAVIQTEKTFLVFTLDKENRAESRPVQVGDWLGNDWMILGGLNPGDRVILDNLLKVRPGTAVSPQAPAEAKAAAPAAS